MRISNEEVLPTGFTDATCFEAEGARVGIVTCHECGAALLLDPRDKINWLQRHANWHNEQEETVQ